jgi:2-polyprenyl-6-methoxyphenol hydroxylase-like FAD-dependent oxidoreductase
MSMVWSAPEARAAHLMALDAAHLAAEVAAAGDHALGALTCESAPQAFDLRLVRVPRVVGPRVALIGDAAHAVHPLAGHGANLGFQDACVLAEVLAASPSWRDVGELALLRQFARARAESVALMQWGTHTLATLFGARQTVASAVRNRGMSIINRIAPARQALVRAALNI